LKGKTGGSHRDLPRHDMRPLSTSIRELHEFDQDRLVEQLIAENLPTVIRGLAAAWPIVQKARESTDAVSDYLLQFYQDAPVTAFVGEPDIGGRIFYTDGLEHTNFRQIKTRLGWVLDNIREHEGDAAAPTIYMGSAAIDLFLPGLSKDNSLAVGTTRPSVRIWISNRTTVAAHYDVLENIACVCAGRRRFTLFPPEQLRNLYVGPIDFTPAGQSISLVDFDAPDFEKFPRFAEALQHAQTAMLEPGDAIYIPSMWWHHVQSLDGFNILINHWWRDVPAYMGAPADALLHAILNIRGLPAEQRKAWRCMFDHYVFEASDESTAHIPRERLGALGTMDEDRARQLRALLRNNLNR
jgi:hypothetical protein